LKDLCHHCFEKGGLLKGIAQVTYVVANKKDIKGWT
jgi:hypothetical protein